jgi:EAL domain-containing protein (putative c-di-GMP-specific phosphodiesterase class I)
MEQRLRSAVDNGDFVLYYQPKISLRSGRVTGVEALLRWTHPARGPVSPTVFIPFAEQSGQISELGHWVLEQACGDRQHWQQHSATDICMSVNVSAHQLMSAGFAQTVRTVLTSTATDPARLTLEVTETVFVRDEERALIVLGDLKDIGIKLALDDFGTEYSSLGYLAALPIDTIKVDQTFIAKLGDQPASQAIVSAIMRLAHSLGMTVVSEGVETARQHQTVTQLGSDWCQGFYFAKPMSASDVDALIHHQADGTGPHLPASPRFNTSKAIKAA